MESEGRGPSLSPGSLEVCDSLSLDPRAETLHSTTEAVSEFLTIVVVHAVSRLLIRFPGTLTRIGNKTRHRLEIRKLSDKSLFRQLRLKKPLSKRFVILILVYIE